MKKTKKSAFPIFLFILTFSLTYIALCFFIPGIRIKLEASPAIYFKESIKHMFLFKALVSSVIGIIPILILRIIKTR